MKTTTKAPFIVLMDVDLKEKLQEIAWEKRESMSEIVRVALAYFIEQEKEREPHFKPSLFSEPTSTEEA